MGSVNSKCGLGWVRSINFDGRNPASNDDGIDDVRAEPGGAGTGEGDDLPHSRDAPRLPWPRQRRRAPATAQHAHLV